MDGTAMPRALLLDWEGTLAYNPQPRDEVQRRMARGLARVLADDGRLRGLDPQRVWRRYRRRLREAAGAGPPGRQRQPAVALRRALRDYGVRVSDEEAARLSVDSYVGDPELGVRMFDESAAALRRARGMGLRLGLVSNREFGMEVFAADMAALGVGDSLDVVLISADVGFAKPHPEPFRAAMRELAVSPGEAVMAGDDPVADVQGAQGVGMRAVWVRRDLARRAEGVHPDATVSSLAELLDLVARL